MESADLDWRNNMVILLSSSTESSSHALLFCRPALDPHKAEDDFACYWIVTVTFSV